jgi:hypothetical protein
MTPPGPADDALADVMATIRLWQGLGISAGQAWEAMGQRGTCTSWAVVSGFMVRSLRDQRELLPPVRRAA